MASYTSKGAPAVRRKVIAIEDDPADCNRETLTLACTHKISRACRGAPPANIICQECSK